MGQKKSLWQQGESARAYWLFILPALALYLLVMFIPTVMSIALSMSDFSAGKKLFSISLSYDGMYNLGVTPLSIITNTSGLDHVLSSDANANIDKLPWHFTGFKEYGKLIVDPIFYRALKNNIYVVLISVFGQIPLGFIFAYIIYRKLVKGPSIWQAILYMPAIISTIIVGIIWQAFIYQPDGALGRIVTEGNKAALVSRINSLGSILPINAENSEKIFEMVSYKELSNANAYPLDKQKQIELFKKYISDFKGSRDQLKDNLRDLLSPPGFETKFRNGTLNILLPTALDPSDEAIARFLNNDVEKEQSAVGTTFNVTDEKVFVQQFKDYIKNFSGTRDALKDSLAQILGDGSLDGEFRTVVLNALLPNTIDYTDAQIEYFLNNDCTKSKLISAGFYPVDKTEQIKKMQEMVSSIAAGMPREIETLTQEKAAILADKPKLEASIPELEAKIKEFQKAEEEADKAEAAALKDLTTLTGSEFVFRVDFETTQKWISAIKLYNAAAEAHANARDATKKAIFEKRNAISTISKYTYRIPEIEKRLELGKDVQAYTNDALARQLGAKYGITEFTSDSNLAMIPVLFVILWLYTGLYLILFLANMQKIDVQIIEAASIDGASEGQVMRHIILPSLSGVIVINAILAISGSLRAFDLIFAMTSGGPSNNTSVLAMYMYNNAFGSAIKDIPYANAISTVMVLISVLLIIVTRLLDKKFGSKE